MKRWKLAAALMSLGILAATPTALGDTAPVAVHSQMLVLEAEGESIEGVLYLPDDDSKMYPTVILCHGFGGNYHFLTRRIAQDLAQNGYAAYAFNFRNPDTRSMLNTSPLTEAKTLNTVIDQIKQQPFVDQSKLFLLGESQGGFVSAYVASQRAAEPDDIRALILYYPAFVLQDDAKARNPHYQEEGYQFPETESIMANQIGYLKDYPDGMVHFYMPYIPGVLRAEGYLGGMKVAEDTLHSDHEAESLSVEIDRAELPADGSSVAMIDLYIEDKYGRRYMLEDREVTVQTEGTPVTVLMDNGDAWDTESFKRLSCKTHNGHLLILLKAGQVRGTASVHIHTLGFEAKTFNISL